MRLTMIISFWLLAACQPAPLQLLPVDAAPGSVLPNLARGPAGQVVLSYVEPSDDGHALRFSRLLDGRWQPSATLAEGDNWLVNWADFPSVVPLVGDLWAAHWLVRQPVGGYAYDAMVALSEDGGNTWQDAVRIHDDTSAAEHGFVSLYADAGGVGVLWLDGRNMIATNPDSGLQGTQLLTRRVSGTGRDEEVRLDPLVCDCCQTDMAVIEQGPIAVYRNRTEAEIRDIYVVRRLAGEWQAPSAVAHDEWRISGCPVNGPAIDGQGQQVVVAWFAAQTGNQVQVAFSSDGGGQFGPAIDVATPGALGRVDVALLANGDAAVSYLQKGDGLLMVARVTPEGVLSRREVAHMETHRGAGFPQMLASGDQLVFAWTDTTGELPVVRSARLDIHRL